MPAVSTRLNSNPNLLYFVLIESLVVPGMSVTIFLFSPINALINEDFPALGLPITANFGRSSERSISSEKSLTTSSSKSPVPNPLMLAIG